jgi:replication factor C subunit 2/4
VQADLSVHEISGVVPGETISNLMGVVGIDENGLNPSLAKGGFEAVRKAVKTVGREGWSAGQILEQVSLPSFRYGSLSRSLPISTTHP